MLCIIIFNTISTFFNTISIHLTSPPLTLEIIDWPKLKVGGIMAGHDYVTNDDGPLGSGQDWSINYDGTKDETGTVVKGAVDKFANMVCRQVTVSYREKFWNTWAIRK